MQLIFSLKALKHRLESGTKKKFSFSLGFCVEICKRYTTKIPSSLQSNRNQNNQDLCSISVMVSSNLGVIYILYFLKMSLNLTVHKYEHLKGYFKKWFLHWKVFLCLYTKRTCTLLKYCKFTAFRNIQGLYIVPGKNMQSRRESMQSSWQTAFL